MIRIKKDTYPSCHFVFRPPFRPQVLCLCGGNARFVSVLSVSVPEFLWRKHLWLAAWSLPLQERGRCRRPGGKTSESTRCWKTEPEVEVSSRPLSSLSPAIFIHIWYISYGRSGRARGRYRRRERWTTPPSWCLKHPHLQMYQQHCFAMPMDNRIVTSIKVEGMPDTRPTDPEIAGHHPLDCSLVLGLNWTPLSDGIVKDLASVWMCAVIWQKVWLQSRHCFKCKGFLKRKILKPWSGL